MKVVPVLSEYEVLSILKILEVLVEADESLVESFPHKLSLGLLLSCSRFLTNIPFANKSRRTIHKTIRVKLAFCFGKYADLIGMDELKQQVISFEDLKVN